MRTLPRTTCNSIGRGRSPRQCCWFGTNSGASTTDVLSIAIPRIQLSRACSIGPSYSPRAGPRPVSVRERYLALSLIALPLRTTIIVLDVTVGRPLLRQGLRKSAAGSTSLTQGTRAALAASLGISLLLVLVKAGSELRVGGRRRRADPAIWLRSD